MLCGQPRQSHGYQAEDILQLPLNGFCIMVANPTLEGYVESLLPIRGVCDPPSYALIAIGLEGMSRIGCFLLPARGKLTTMTESSDHG